MADICLLTAEMTEGCVWPRTAVDAPPVASMMLCEVESVMLIPEEETAWWGVSVRFRWRMLLGGGGDARVDIIVRR